MMWSQEVSQEDGTGHYDVLIMAVHSYEEAGLVVWAES